MAPEKAPPPSSSPPETSPQTQLSVLRTALSAERSLMSWVRTGLSLISFGFTAYKFLQAFQKQETTTGFGPRRLGILLLALGSLCGVVAFTDYVRTMRKLQKQIPTPIEWFPAFVALAVAGLGLALIVGVAAHLGIF